MDNEKNPRLRAALIGLFRRPEPEPERCGCPTMGIRDMMQKMGVKEFEELIDSMEEKEKHENITKA